MIVGNRNKFTTRNTFELDCRLPEPSVPGLPSDPALPVFLPVSPPKWEHQCVSHFTSLKHQALLWRLPRLQRTRSREFPSQPLEAIKSAKIPTHTVSWAFGETALLFLPVSLWVVLVSKLASSWEGVVVRGFSVCSEYFSCGVFVFSVQWA